MQIEGWKYYNHAMLPTSEPHETPDMRPIESGAVWKAGGGTPLFARWTTDWDCGYETNWWYVIKDEPFDIDSLKSKRRYEVNKGNKNFEVRNINPAEYGAELYQVTTAAFSAYPKKYRPSVDRERFMKGIETWKEYDVFGAFFRETNEPAGYALLKRQTDKFLDFTVLKTMPAMEKFAVNAALVYGILNYYNEFLKSGGIICDGARSINHETHFQDYLEKYFGFRKAYCKMHIVYNPKVKWLIKLLYPFRQILGKLDEIGTVHQVNAVLRMDEIARENDE